MTRVLYFTIFIVLATTAIAYNLGGSVTLPIEERIRQLKIKINQHIKHLNKGLPAATTLVNENLEYEDLGNNPISPIPESDEKKEDGKLKLRKLKTTSITTVHPWSTKFRVGREGTMYEDIEERPKKKYLIEKPVETFYRRLITKDLMNKPVPWMHCQDVITPYFNGMKKTLGPPKRVTHTDSEVVRLTELLGKNITGYSHLEIRALMYHINDLKIRLFQWDVSAIRLLFNTISPQKKHTFRVLKRSIQALLKSWHMDIHDIKKLIEQTRLFRPPCVDNNYGGSTLSSKVSRFIKSTTPTVTISDDCDDKSDND